MPTTRRGFLGAAGIVGLGAAGVTPSFAKIEPTPWGIKLGIATYSLRSFDRAKAIEMMKTLETPWISIKEVHLAQKNSKKDIEAGAKEYVAANLVSAGAKDFTDAGFKIMSGGNVDMKENTVEGLRPHFEYAKAAGMPMMVCAPKHDNIKMIEGLVKEYNIRIAIHNHGPEDKEYPTPQSVLEVVRSLDRRCGLCMDVGHSARTGVDVVKSIAEAGDRLFDMHVKDLRDFTSKDSQCDCGDGMMPFPGIFKQLKKMNYQGCVNLEYEINDKNPMPGMQRSFSYMRGVLAGLASA
ncbi:MAG TPA: sugar phosphate isomerase/epimerase [Bryobacteraceae bacterium]|nr:sugar phosphate isomerase/epimerase [Bryobacteraceae bacterium]